MAPGSKSTASATRLVRDLWRSARRPAIFRRCALIALVVGTLLTVVNQLDVITGARADSSFMLRVAANYLIPFVVSNLGAMASLSPER